MEKGELKENLIDRILNNKWEDDILPLKTNLVYYKCAIMEIEAKFKALDIQFNVSHDRNPIESIKTRLKSVERIIKKLNKYNFPLTLESIEENIWDIAGIRVICSFTEDIYFLEKSLIEQDDIRLIMRKDYIENPKPNGYRSLHLRIEIPVFLSSGKKWVKAEIQFRTIAMDFWASLEHKIRYNKQMTENIDEINKELLECAKMCTELDKKMQKVKNKSNIERFINRNKIIEILIK